MTARTNPGSRGVNKYGAKRTELDGQVFDSKAESRRFRDLRLMEAAGAITNLRRQVPYPLRVNGVLIQTYRADHVYEQDGRTVVEDVKSPATAARLDWKRTKKLMQAVYGIAVQEVEG